jgi:di/tricarboxylate transporter
MPVGAVGLIGLTFAGISGYIEHDPNKALRWMLGGFSESTVWLIVGAFVFSIGYRKSGLGRRLALLLVRSLGRRTIGLGYAVAFSDLVLAQATPSNTARSAAPSIRSSATSRASMAPNRGRRPAGSGPL